MKHNRRTIGLVAGLTAAALSITGVTASAAPSAGASAPAAVVAAVPSAASAAALEKDGRAVFGGLYFGQGQVGESLSRSPLFSDLRKGLAQNDKAESVKVADALMDRIDAKHPGFFAEFSRKSRSGDPRRVEAAVNDGQAKLVAELTKGDKSARVPENGQRCGATVAVAAAAVHVAAVFTAAGAVVTVTVAVGANFVKAKNWFWSVAPQGADGALGHDEAVASVTNLLKTA
ncbi:hypothetical protein GCM10010329_03290 [Streptomyces spiroverticillatus]|uniref:Sporulation delaying protein family toxin n=1 Tax=Streptomyces finlayi TaxID=67296 RepID=A0A918WSL5_9ACTN|nr:hypothetical protein [Streptomyces finlayi]GGZ86767.1 hypothetical protein GCM10010329_03290 [Streptomyces spiroverticillatus]GHC78235.1 hypothetical protein GCM10010334_03270 [Streptomyces finlayi]